MLQVLCRCSTESEPPWWLVQLGPYPEFFLSNPKLLAWNILVLRLDETLRELKEMQGSPSAITRNLPLFVSPFF